MLVQHFIRNDNLHNGYIPLQLPIEDNHVRLTGLPPCRSNARAANFNASWTASIGRS
jgi:hypothetical protein